MSLIGVVAYNDHLLRTTYDHYDFGMKMKKGAGGLSPLLRVDRGSSRPLHAQIYAGFRAAILDRSLRAGERIPSTRTLARELGVSRIPALNAYSQLLAEGYFESRTGAGTFVSSSLPGLMEERAEERAPASHVRARGAARSRSSVSRASSKANSRRQLAARVAALPRHEKPPWFGGTGAFSFSQPGVDAFPLHIWSKIVARYWRNVPVSALEYGDPMGQRPLREAIATYLRTSRSVRCEWQQIMIVSGSQQALDVTSRVLLDAGNPVWIEEPGYWLARNILTAAGCRIVPVPVDRDGLNVAAGIAACRQTRAAIVAPSHQFPLGATMSATRRLQLLEWARRESAWIIEDDYDSEYRYDSKPIASLQGLDHSERVIYVGTFSKVLFPALRVGYVVMPPDLIPHFIAVRHAMDVGPPQMIQSVLADFLNEGHFSRHIRRMRQIYGERRDVLINCIQEQLGGVLEVHGAQAGLHLTVTLPRGAKDRAICTAAALRKLWLWPLSPTYIGAGARHGFILGYAGVTAAEIPAGVKRLREVLDEVRWK
jgi:GntR family transcriptional regulator/MocR family aminotransferase